MSHGRHGTQARYTGTRSIVGGRSVLAGDRGGLRGRVWLWNWQRSRVVETGFHGVYHEVTPERIVQTTEWEGMPGHVGLETALLEERDGKTLMTAIALFPTVEDRDANVANGMEGGARETYDRLDEVIQSLGARV